MAGQIPEGNRFTDALKFRRIGEGGGGVLYECWGEAVEAYTAQAVAAEREQWKAKAIEACNSAGDGPENGCCPTYGEEAREACIEAIERA